MVMRTGRSTSAWSICRRKLKETIEKRASDIRTLAIFLSPWAWKIARKRMLDGEGPKDFCRGIQALASAVQENGKVAMVRFEFWS